MFLLFKKGLCALNTEHSNPQTRLIHGLCVSTLFRHVYLCSHLLDTADSLNPFPFTHNSQKKPTQGILSFGGQRSCSSVIPFSFVFCFHLSTSFTPYQRTSSSFKSFWVLFLFLGKNTHTFTQATNINISLPVSIFAFQTNSSLPPVFSRTSSSFLRIFMCSLIPYSLFLSLNDDCNTISLLIGKISWVLSLACECDPSSKHPSTRRRSLFSHQDFPGVFFAVSSSEWNFKKASGKILSLHLCKSSDMKDR